MATEPRSQAFWRRRRTVVLIVAALLFLPPLSILFQLSADTNFCGRWCPRMFFVWRRGMDLGSFFDGWVRAGIGVALVGLILLATVWLGRIWCSHLCPVGSGLELGSRLVPKRLKIDFSRVPAAPFRYAFLAVFMVVPALGIGSLCCNYCNFAALPRLFGAPFSGADATYFLRVQGGINLGLLLGLGVFAAGGRAYCNLLCPIGALDALANRFGFRKARRMRIDPDRCTECGECVAACPVWAISEHSKPVIDQLSCMPCGLCERACSEGAIGYGDQAT
ncbi:MAG TPA: 4Fe-4S binding protein [Candidatus Sulfomarinibacteraceae bacterium]|nr:4Fe-4S binding protein [Candidatus Sulfomarinibacteraceae bacterium]